jgi:hypothetical protein
MVTVAKHINWITINPLEYLLDDDGEAMEFVSKDAAKAFLKAKGFTDADTDGFAFENLHEDQQHQPEYAGERK